MSGKEGQGPKQVPRDLNGRLATAYTVTTLLLTLRVNKKKRDGERVRKFLALLSTTGR